MAGHNNVNFHQTFKPEVQYIGSILNIADGNSPVSVKDISALTGIPQGQSSGKVEPHICYAEYMGLIETKKNNGLILMKKTKMGETICNEDPGLQEDLTILLCHTMLLREKNGANVWSTVFKKILPQYKTGIKKEILLKELAQIFEGKINKKNFAPFLSSYEDMFSRINILEIENDVINLKSLVYNKEFIYLYAYAMWEYWDEKFPSYQEISSIQLVEMNFGKVFGWDEQMEYVVLEQLSDIGVLRMNRQLMPYSILRLVDKNTVLQRLYSELC